MSLRWFEWKKEMVERILAMPNGPLKWETIAAFISISLAWIMEAEQADDDEPHEGV